MSDRLFVAHTSHDAVLADGIKSFVESVFSTADVFLSEDGIRGGTGWFERIRSALEDRPVILAVATPRSVENRWVHFEAGAGFVEGRTIPLCAGGLPIMGLASPLRELNAREVTESDLRRLVADLAKLWGHKRLPADSLIRDQVEQLIHIESETRKAQAKSQATEIRTEGGASEAAVSRDADLIGLVEFALSMDQKLQNWERYVRLASTNGVSLADFLLDVYGYRVPDDADWFGTTVDQDDVLKDELRTLPSDMHRLIIEYSYGLWYRPVRDEFLAPALMLTQDQLAQKRATAVSVLRERKAEAVHGFRRALEPEYRFSQ